VSISEGRKSRVEILPMVSKRTQRRPVGAAVLHGHPFRVKATALPRRRFLHLAAGAAAVPATSRIAMAQAYPTRPVRFIVPFPPGGATDPAARFIAESMSRSFSQRVYVENRSGANGIIGIEAAAKSASDGHTVLVTPNVVMTNPYAYKINTDPLKDLIPVIQLSRQPYVLAVHPALGVHSLAELVALAKRQPGLSFATGGGTDASYMAVQWFARLLGVSLEHVAYRGGGPAILARAREDRSDRFDAAHSALPGWHPAVTGANDGTAFARTAGRTDLSGGRRQWIGHRPVDRRVLSSRHAGRDC
jgi:tripartite-type tricarboxylate transporter receptor subunit TctC